MILVGREGGGEERRGAYARRPQSFNTREVLIEHMPQALDGARDDAAAAGGAGREVEGLVCGELDDGGGD